MCSLRSWSLGWCQFIDFLKFEARPSSQLRLSYGGVSRISQVCLRSILFIPKSCFCLNGFHSCNRFKNTEFFTGFQLLPLMEILQVDFQLFMSMEFTFFFIPILWSILQTVLSVALLLADERFFVFLKRFLGSCTLCHFIFIKISKKLIGPKELIYGLFRFSH